MAEAPADLPTNMAAAFPETPPRRQPQTDPTVTSTPAVRGRSSMLYTSTHYTRHTRMAHIGEDMRDRYAGSMKPSQFLDMFLPKVDGVPSPQWDAEAEKKFEKVYRVNKKFRRKEVEMYDPMIDALKDFCPQLKLVNTSNHADSVTWALEPDLIKPDVTAYSTDNFPQASRKTDMSKAEIIMEFKLDLNDDGFLDRKEHEIGEAPFERTSQTARDTRNQIALYAAAQLATQFRTFTFSVLIVRDKARLIRWDRSGAILTEAFRYAEKNFLAEFFWRYSRASRGDRGIDTTVTIPGDNDAHLVQAARKTFELKADEEVLKFEVADEKTKQKTYYFGGRPSFSATASPIGRCTRGIRVVDEQEQPAFLKDTWRIDLKYMKKEGMIYEKLHEVEVPNIPTVLVCGDVPGKHRKTRANKYYKHGDRRVRWQPHQHYRLVFREVGRDLTSFETVWEVINAMADAIEAHKVAYEKAGLLHRDISAGNILLTDKGKGLLIDWDLCKEVTDEKPRRAERTGTWQFMSARIQSAKTPIQHLLADDLESFSHVLTWVTLRFTPHDIAPQELTLQLMDVFDHALLDPKAGISQGGRYKANALEVQYMRRKAQLPEGALKDLIAALESVCRVRYIPSPSEAERAEYQETKQDILAGGRGNVQKRLANQPVHYYDTSLKALETSDWMWNQFREAARQRDKLQTKRVFHPLVKPEGQDVETKKRKSATSQLDEEEESGRPRQRQKIASSSEVEAVAPEDELGDGGEGGELWAEEDPKYASEYEVEEEAEEKEKEGKGEVEEKE